ncbi:MAG: hypothetical protein KGJ23_12585 [Euryarchaeota archaeon]|nr:hypothetical protein [Euryarchaeota archaeon]MDE1837435.1 hypothetical protein [Euryarchaeota archaeon]MDE2045599.1 hypothetical protein [Thermoplasmata archaeon]
MPQFPARFAAGVVRFVLPMEGMFAVALALIITVLGRWGREWWVFYEVALPPLGFLLLLFLVQWTARSFDLVPGGFVVTALGAPPRPGFHRKFQVSWSLVAHVSVTMPSWIRTRSRGGIGLTFFVAQSEAVAAREAWEAWKRSSVDVQSEV